MHWRLREGTRDDWQKVQQTQTIQVCTRAEWTQENEYTSETTVVSMTPDNTEVRWIHMPQTPKAYQAKLYAVLRTLRDSETRQIIVEPVPDTPEWSAIANRLARLSSRDLARSHPDHQGLNSNFPSVLESQSARLMARAYRPSPSHPCLPSHPTQILRCLVDQDSGVPR